MLAPTTVRRIEELLAASELSQRQIATLVGVNRETVGRIARGVRTDYDAQRRAKEGEFEWVDKPRRCGRCGKLGHFAPCYPCWLEGKFTAQADEHAEPTDDRFNPVGIGLKTNHQRRYLQILNFKIRTGIRPASNLAMLQQAVFEGELPMTTFDKKKYARWFLNSAAELSPLLELYELLQAADSVAAKWDVLKWAGDTIVESLDTYPPPDKVRAKSLAALQTHAELLGVEWQRLLDVLPLVVRMVRLVREAGAADEWHPTIGLKVRPGER